MSLIGLILTVWRWKWMVLGFFLTVQGFIWWKVATTHERYAVQTKFIFKSNGPSNEMSNLAALVGIRRQGSESNISDFFDIILFTDPFLERVFQRKWRITGDSVTLEDFWRLEPPKERDNQEYRELRKKVDRISSNKYISVSKEGSGLVTLETLFEDPYLAFDVNVFIIESLNDYLLNNTKSQSKENRKFIEKRLEEVLGELRASEKKVLDFNLRNKEFNSPSLQLEFVRLKREVEINQELFMQLKKELELAKIEETKETPVIEVVEPAKFPLGPKPFLQAKQYVVISAAGLMLGVLLSLMLSFLASSIRLFTASGK